MVPIVRSKIMYATIGQETHLDGDGEGRGEGEGEALARRRLVALPGCPRFIWYCFRGLFARDLLGRTPSTGSGRAITMRSVLKRTTRRIRSDGPFMAGRVGGSGVQGGSGESYTDEGTRGCRKWACRFYSGLGTGPQMFMCYL